MGICNCDENKWIIQVRCNLNDNVWIDVRRSGTLIEASNIIGIIKREDYLLRKLCLYRPVKGSKEFNMDHKEKIMFRKEIVQLIENFNDELSKGKINFDEVIIKTKKVKSIVEKKESNFFIGVSYEKSLVDIKNIKELIGFSKQLNNLEKTYIEKWESFIDKWFSNLKINL